MRCGACGQRVLEGTKYCPSCGARIDEQAQVFEEEQVTGSGMDYGAGPEVRQSYEQPRTRRKGMPMKWYKFLIYISLFLTAITNIFTGCQVVLGLHYVQDGVDYAEQVYSTYAGLKIVDIVYGICVVAVGVFAIIVRMKLARYKKDGPKSLLILYIGSLAISVLYLVAAMFVLRENTMTIDTATSIIVSIFMILANKIYFEKRGHLFTE